MEWRKAFLGWLIACSLLAVAIALIGDPDRTMELQGWIARLTIPLVIWLVGWPIYYTLRPKRAPQAVRGGSHGADDT
ncbi:hypothetical protein [Pengzhenrongella phosphoraccumulans]|uniref:hypothetical protein n=1 Tax=Pengzhenrongella phosphoraccumulans TaxID=3114394 RepID=UPI00388D0B30